MVDLLNNICKGTFVSLLGIEFTTSGEGYIEACMPVGDKLQPTGHLHGGASLALAETIASGGSYLMVDREAYDVLGLQVSGNHLAVIDKGMLYARAEIIHQGKNTHVWDVKIKNGGNKLISVTRVTLMIVKRK